MGAGHLYPPMRPMNFSQKIVLKLPIGNPKSLGQFVDTCVSDNVGWVFIWGAGALAVEEEIDWLFTLKSAGLKRTLVTSTHDTQDESFEATVHLARISHDRSEPQVVSI